MTWSWRRMRRAPPWLCDRGKQLSTPSGRWPRCRGSWCYHPLSCRTSTGTAFHRWVRGRGGCLSPGQTSTCSWGCCGHVLGSQFLSPIYWKRLRVLRRGDDPGLTSANRALGVLPWLRERGACSFLGPSGPSDLPLSGRGVRCTSAGPCGGLGFRIEVDCGAGRSLEALRARVWGVLRAGICAPAPGRSITCFPSLRFTSRTTSSPWACRVPREKRPPPVLPPPPLDEAVEESLSPDSLRVGRRGSLFLFVRVKRERLR